jgi:hypothetical protein
VETAVADTFIYQRLAADGTLAALIGGTAAPRIYADMAPQGAAYPCVIFQSQAMTDTRGVGTVRVWADLIYVVKAVDKVASYGGALGSAAARISAVLHGAGGTAGGGTVIGAIRERIFRLPEVTDGVRYSHLGCVFRVYSQG